MDFSNFYLLSEGFTKGALRLKPRDDIDDPFALIKGELIPEKPIIFEHSEGGEPKDLIGTEFAMVDILSDRVFKLFRENQFTGWATYPVEIYGKNSELIKGFSGLIVLGRCGKLDNSLCKQEWRNPPVPTGKPYQTWVGMYFDLKKWDGSDIFIPESTGYKIVTERVKTAIEKAKFKNITFKRLTEIERMKI